MRREYVPCYAEYIVRFIEEYAKCGIRISAITPQNEPHTGQQGKMPACIWHRDIEAEFIVTLKKKSKEHGLNVKIWIFDHDFSDWETVEWSLDAHEGLIDCCDGAAFHYYHGELENTVALKRSYPSLSLHFTEGGPRLWEKYDSDHAKCGTIAAKVLSCGYSSFTG